jgi:hypothetical protein
MRLYRQRWRSGLRCLTVELRETEIDALVCKGLLQSNSRNDRVAVLSGLYACLEQTLSGDQARDGPVAEATAP